MKAPHSAVNAEQGREQIKSNTTSLVHNIGVRNGILTPEHVQRLGTAIWVYLWLIDKQTKPSGLVLGGAPITTSKIGVDLGLSERKVRRDLKALASGPKPYIQATRRFCGLTIQINKPKKRWERSATSASKSGQKRHSFRPESAAPRDKSRTVSIDSAITRRLEAI